MAGICNSNPGMSFQNWEYEMDISVTFSVYTEIYEDIN
jgi:hypothetical protein